MESVTCMLFSIAGVAGVDFSIDSTGTTEVSLLPIVGGEWVQYYGYHDSQNHCHHHCYFCKCGGYPKIETSVG